MARVVAGVIAAASTLASVTAPMPAAGRKNEVAAQRLIGSAAYGRRPEICIRPAPVDLSHADPGSVGSDGLSALLPPRPGDSLDSWVDTPHFRVHFGTKGDTRLPNWPDRSALDSLGGFLEKAYRFYHGDLGLPVPPGDGTRGGSDLIDCYLMQLPEGSGRATPEPATGAHCPGATTGYFEMSLWSEEGEDARGLTAHEYFHVVQFGEGSFDTWFDESTAAWAETAVWPLQRGMLDDAACLLQTPYLELWDDAACRTYGSMLFWIFCCRSYGANLPVEVLRRTCGADVRSALRRELAARDATMGEALARFALWNETAGSRDDGRHYPMGSTLQQVSFQAEHTGFPVQSAIVPAWCLARPAGSNYIRFAGPGRRDTLGILFDGDPSVAQDRRVSLVIRRARPGGFQRSDTTLAPDPRGDCRFRVGDWANCLDATLIVTNFDTAAGRLEYTYSAAETGAEAFDGVSALDIFDVQGRRIRRLLDATLPRGEREISWDGRDDQGLPARSGAYWLRFSRDSAVSVRRVTVIR
jgi:hypothetical protein